MDQTRTFGNTLRTLRESAGIGSKDLSRIVNKSLSYVSQIENGRNKSPDYETAFKLMESLGHPIHEIKDFLDIYDIRPSDSVKEVKSREDKSWRYELKFEKSKLKTMKLKQELNVFLDHDFSKAERVISNLYDVVMGDDQVFNFFTSLFEIDYARLSEEERQLILMNIKSIAKKEE